MMMKMAHNVGKYNITFIYLLFIVFLTQFCTKNEKPSKLAKQTETMNSGKFTAFIEDGLYKLLKTPIEWYRKDYPKVELNIEIVNSREAMKQLLAGNARVIVISRDYLRDEDSLMKVYNVKRHHREPLADDGLVLFASPDFPIDTINHSQLHSIVTNKNTSFGKLFPESNFRVEPKLVINNVNSSEYANFSYLIAKNKPITVRMEFINGSDSVKNLVRRNKNLIGICYLSQVVKDTGFKFIRIGYNDSTGKYIKPKPVHQGYIVQGLYPYKITHWAYLLEDRRNLPFWFAKFLAVEEKVQKYFLDSGIVPAFARIKLIEEE